MADNVALFQVGCAPRVDAAVVNWVVVALAEEVSFEFTSLRVLDLLYAGDAMHDWDVLPINVVNDDIADVDLVILEEDQDVATVHRRLHRAGEHDDHRRLVHADAPETLPHHERGRHDESELDALENKLQSQHGGVTYLSYGELLDLR